MTPRIDGETSTHTSPGGAGGGGLECRRRWCRRRRRGIAEAEADAALAGSVAAAAKAGAVEVSVPRKLATACGFSVYGLHAAATLATSAAQKRAQLLAVLRSRALVYAEADGAALLARLLLAFLHGDGYNYGTNGGAYQALRSRAQAEISASVGESLKIGEEANLNLTGSGQPVLVPFTRRLGKKLGDLLQLFFVLYDWQILSPHMGTSHAYGAADHASFRAELLVLFQAFSHGLVFDWGSAPAQPQSLSVAQQKQTFVPSAEGVLTLRRMRLMSRRRTCI